VPVLPDLSQLSHAEKDALILALWQRLDAAERRIAELEAKLAEPPKTPDNSSLPPSKGQKPNQAEKPRRTGPRQGSLGRKGGGRPLACDPDATVIAKALACMHCRAALTDAEQVLHDLYDKIDLPPVRPVVTRVERYVGRCLCCGGVTLAPVPEGLEPGTPFSVNILALAIYLRFTHAISYQRLSRLFQHLFALQISEGALDAMFRRAKPCFDNEVAAILARLRRSRIICSDETTVRIDGRTHWNWVFQNQTVVIHVIRNSRAASVVTDVLDGHRPSIWVSDLYSAQQRHADLWQICLAHQLRDCQYAIEAGDTIFAPRMKVLLLRAVVIARRAHGTGRKHASFLSTPARPRSERHHGPGSHQSARQAAAKTLRQEPKPLVHLPRTSRHTARQQRQRTGTAANRNIPQSDRRFSFELGRRFVRCRQIRGWHSHATWLRCLSGNPYNPRRRFGASGRLSSYHFAGSSSALLSSMCGEPIGASCQMGSSAQSEIIARTVAARLPLTVAKPFVVREFVSGATNAGAGWIHGASHS
jgi:transposase